MMIPVPGKAVVSGRKQTAKDVDFIKPGETLRREVINKLGEPDWSFDDYRIIAYTWETMEAFMIWGLGPGAAGAEPVSRPYVLLISFSSDDRVSHFEIDDRWPLETVREKAQDWAKEHGITRMDETGIRLFPNRSIIYIYRPGGFSDAPLMVPPEVSLDGRLVAALRKGTYIAVVVLTGWHTVSVDPDPSSNTFLRPDQTPIRTVTLEAKPDRASYLEVKIRWGFGALDPLLTVRPEADATPVIEKLDPT